MVRRRVSTALVALLCAAVCGAGGAVAASAPAWVRDAAPSAGPASWLATVACPAAARCVALGSANNLQGGPTRGVTMLWDGARWQLGPATAVGLESIACVGANRCVAAGREYVGKESALSRTLVESWDGGAWTRVASPNVGSLSNELTDVSCTSASFCVAVGRRDRLAPGNPTARSLIETWNGSAWSVTPSPNVGRWDNLLTGVSCASSSFCEASGWYEDESGKPVALIETWDGRTWSVAPTPALGAGALLSGVSCTSTTHCVAAGTAIDDTTGAPGPLIAVWNGAVWARQPAAQAPQTTAQLARVECQGPSFCVAVGVVFHDSDDNDAFGVIEEWHGHGWSIASSPNPGLSSTLLADVACAGTACKVVGTADPIVMLAPRSVILTRT